MLRSSAQAAARESAGATSFIPDSAPFSDEQREWLNALFANLSSEHGISEHVIAQAALAVAARDGVRAGTPWHKVGLSLPERMMLAEGFPIARRIMAALGQQDCRQCGYDCEGYAEAVASLSEARLGLCVPGGKDTTRMLNALLAEAAGGAAAFDAALHRRQLEIAAEPPPDVGPGYDRDRPVAAVLKSRYRLSKSPSEKATFHVEIDIGEAGIVYEPGDAFGIYPENDGTLVDAVIAAIGARDDDPVLGRTLREALIATYSLGTPPDALFDLIACLTGGPKRQLAKRLAAGEDPEGDAAQLDVLAALEKFPGLRPDPEAFVESLDPLQPRLYSIASSPRVAPGTVAVTVDHVRYAVAGRRRDGVASSWLAARAPLETTMMAFVQPAPHFRLPESGDTPIIMIGPGTGIAPFRAFLQERAAIGARGRAWLFFGHRNQATDFFYESELAEFQAAGVFGKLSLAWSRDGETRSYVQHKMIEQGEELWDWLFDGAHIYVCGDALQMAGDVEAALVEITADYGNRDKEAARAYIDNLRKTGRYQTDVY